MGSSKNVVVSSFSLDPDKFDTITNYCRERGCSRSWFIGQAVDLFLAACLDNKHDYDTAVAAWQAYEAGGFKSAPAADVFAKAGV